MTKPALYLTLITLGKEEGNGMDGFMMWGLSEGFWHRGMALVFSC
jgi:hypothetical protein